MFLNISYFCAKPLEIFQAKLALLVYGKDLVANSEINPRLFDPFHLAVLRERLKGIEETMEIMGMLTSSENHASSKPCSEISASLVLKFSNLLFNTLDTRIGWTLSSIQQLELVLGPASAYDYHIVLMSLVKPFLQEASLQHDQQPPDDILGSERNSQEAIKREDSKQQQQEKQVKHKDGEYIF